MRCADCWHPHLHAGRWQLVGGKRVCPTCHPMIGTPGFERAIAPLRAHLDTVSKRVT